MIDHVPNWYEYLNDLKTRYTPTNVLDIGAYKGEFSEVCRYLWNNVNCFMIEANPRCENYLKETNIPYLIECLGDSEREVNFFNDPNNILSAGYSYYKENTIFYENPKLEQRTLKKLSSIVEPVYDFIKIDTQGSELDIINGGEEVISSAQVVVIECCLPTLEYNIGGASLLDIMKKMNSLGFINHEAVWTTGWSNFFGDSLPDNFPIQIDILFSK